MRELMCVPSCAAGVPTVIIEEVRVLIAAHKEKQKRLSETLKQKCAQYGVSTAGKTSLSFLWMQISGYLTVTEVCIDLSFQTCTLFSFSEATLIFSSF